MDEVEKRFGCDECGHTFVMECEEDMIPRFCPFCSFPVRNKDDDDDEDEWEDDYPYDNA